MQLPVSHRGSAKNCDLVDSDLQCRLFWHGSVYNCLQATEEVPKIAILWIPICSAGFFGTVRYITACKPQRKCQKLRSCGFRFAAPAFLARLLYRYTVTDVLNLDVGLYDLDDSSLKILPICRPLLLTLLFQAKTLYGNDPVRANGIRLL